MGIEALTASDAALCVAGMRAVARARDEEGEGAFDQAMRSQQTEEEREREKAEAVHDGQMQVVRDYIETYGAPEEKEDEYAQLTFLQMMQQQQEEDDRRGQGLPGNALKTWADVVQDPEDEGEVHVYTVKTDIKGKAKVTRHVQFDSGDGEDRSQLTPERAKAKAAQEKQAVRGEAAKDGKAHAGEDDDEA